MLSISSPTYDCQCTSYSMSLNFCEIGDCNASRLVRCLEIAPKRQISAGSLSWSYHVSLDGHVF